MNLSPVLAQQAPAGSSAIVQLLPIALIAIVFYLLVFRPMKVRQRKLEATIKNLKAGDRVITSGGIYGTLAGI
ncbi:MAG: preprotein translocase subunit YajC [Acidobacteria bacterium]|nr:preprotein translocase subunit YajC [Acidobacteriota bacterium]